MRSKTAVFGAMAGLGLALMVASQAATAGIERGPVDEILKEPVAATVGAFGPDQGGEQIRAAMEQSAYRWSLTLLSEHVATERAQVIWEEVRNEPGPYEAYGQRLQDWGERERATMADVLTDLQAMEADDPSRAEFERLLFAAQYAAYSESSLIAARSTLDTAAENPERYYESSLGRRTIAYPLAQTAIFLHAANGVLEAFSPVPESPSMDLHSLEHFFDDAPGQSGWLLKPHGTAHTTARQLISFERYAATNQDVGKDINASLDRLVNKLEPLQSSGFTGARIMAVSLDVAWWTSGADGADGDGAPSPAHQEMEARLAATVEAARFEVDALMSVPLTEQEAGQGSGEVPIWLPLGPVATPALAGIAVLALIGVVGATRATVKRRRSASARRIQSLRGHKKGPGRSLLTLIVAALLAASGITFGDDADGAPSPVDPAPEPVAVSPNERHSFFLDVLVDSDNQVHFAWGECLDPPEGGCADGRMVMNYRVYDLGTDSWSDPGVIVQPPEGQDAYLPVLQETGEGIALVWLQGVAVETRTLPPSKHPAEVWTCIVQDGACEQKQRLSAPDAGVESAAAAVGSDGLLRVTWAEAREQEGHIVFRQQTSNGWGAPVEFSDGGEDQRQPAVAVTQNGTAHVVWLAHPFAGEKVYRVVYHASVDGATNEASIIDHVSTPILTTQGAALEAQGDVLHLVFGSEHGLYHRTLIDGVWTDPYNVSQSDRNTQRPDIAATQQGITVVWMESVYPDPPFRLRVAENVDGMWLRPDVVIDPPHRALSMPKMDADTVDRLHLAWPGRTSDEGAVRPYYETLSSDHEEGVDPPEIGGITPEDRSWNRHEPVEMKAQLNLSAPLERDDTQWLINGETVNYAASGGTLSASIPDLPEGTHEVELTVTDRAGNSDQKEWTFHVDRTQPQFTSRIVDENGDDAEGWLPGAVRAEGEILSEGGAPARVEIQATLPEDGPVARLGGDDERWTTVSGDNAVALPEGFLLEVTARARDEAGNIKFGDIVQVGWDASTPELAFDVPEWATSSNMEIPVDAGNRSGGAPIDMHAELAPENDASEPTRITARFEASAPRPVIFEGVDDGRYKLTVTSIRNVAGTAQESIPGPWSLGVDTEAPELTVEETDGHFVVEALDEVSGIGFLRATQRGDIVETSNEEEGAGTASIRVPVSADRVVIEIGDVAGNERRLGLNPDGTLEVNEETESGDEGQESGNDGPLGTGQPDLRQRADEDERQGQSIPGPTLPVAMVLVTLIIWLTATRRRMNAPAND